MKLLILRPGIAVILIFFASQFSHSQVNGDKSENPGDIRYIEELFIQTDRDIYIAGESVFIKIFKLNGITHTQSHISQVAYVELLDYLNNPLRQLKISLNGFSGSGELLLPQSLPTGNYLIRSCTNWMQNFSSDLFSYTRISVINPFEDINKIKIPVPGQLPDSVAFYPEGGSFVSGIETLVGFRCMNFNGTPAEIKGIVVDSENNTLCRVQSGPGGHGFFSVKPSAKSRLYLLTGKSGNNTVRYPLPVVRDSGIVLSVMTTPGKDSFRITIRQKGTIDPDKRFFLLYSTLATPPLKRELALDTDTLIMYQKDILPYGLASIMITDEEGLPFAKRWVYNEKKSDINLNIQLQEKIISTREKVKIDISVTDTGGKPVKSDLTISVVRSFLTEEAGSRIQPGYLQLPLLATLETNYQHSDINAYLVFYSNEGMLPGSDKRSSYGSSVYLPELRGHLVSGIITNTDTGNPVSNENIVLSFVGEKARCRFSRTDERGHFNFVISEPGTREIVIQPLSPVLNDYNVELNNPFPRTLNKYVPLPFYPDSSKVAEINKAIISMQVRGIYEPLVKSMATSSVIEETDFYGVPDDTILITRFIELASLKEIIKEIVPWVSIYRKDGRSKFKLINGPLSQPFEADPLMLVDGVPVNDLDLILTINPVDLKRIEILRERYLVSDIILEGIIHFITWKGNLSSPELNESVYRREFQALQEVNYYDWPDYSNDTTKNSRIPDFRNTLYWDPNLSTGESGKAAVEFFTSDEPGEYTIIVAGMTSDGKSCRSEIHFQVKPENIR